MARTASLRRRSGPPGPCRLSAAAPALSLLLAVPIAAATCGASLADGFPHPGEWPCYRGDQALDARARARGEIAAPQIAWKHFTGVLETHFVVEPGSTDTTVDVPGANIRWAELDVSDPRWGLSRPMGEIEGRRQPITVTSLVTYADVRPDLPGLEKLEFESGFAKPTQNGQWQPCVGRCLAWQDGAGVKLWETQPVDMLFSPLPLVGDFDADGKLEVAILPWYELLILDARTGAVKDRCRFTEGRSYGFFGVYDLDGDGRSEFLVQADFAKHVDVLGCRGGKLALLWRREIELDISNPQRILSAYPRPAADVDADGKLEVLFSAYNEAGDHRWHLSVCDGMTGATKANLSDEYLQGVVDVNGDGVAEVLTIETSGAGIPDRGTLLVRSLRGGEPRALWRRDHAAWQTWEPPLPPNVNSGATWAQRDALCRPSPRGARAVIRERVEGAPDEVLLRVGTWGDGGFAFDTTVRGRHLEAFAVSPEGALLAGCAARLGETLPIAVSGGQAQIVGSQCRWGPLSASAVVREAGEGPATIVVQGAGEELVALRPPAGDQPAAERWRIAGRGQSTAWPGEAKGPVLADLFGDGRRQILHATAAPSGCARLVASSLQPQEIWHHDFPTIPGTPPVWNTGGLILWQVGHLTHARALDVLVTVRRSMMHSEETYALSGADGRELWHRDRQVSNRGVGGTPFALADFDGDGLEDVASLHPSLVYILKGSTGQDLVAKDASWPGVPAQPVYWGLPIAGDLENNGSPSLLFATERRSMTGLVRRDGSLAWWDALDRSPQSLPAVGDFDGDGRMEAIGIGYDDGIRCYDTAGGKVEWRMPAPVPGNAIGSASADLNSDGRDEAVFAIGSTLCGVGSAGPGAGGSLLWRIELPVPVGPPSLADLDGRGKVSILVMGGDRYVYCVR